MQVEYSGEWLPGLSRPGPVHAFILGLMTPPTDGWLGGRHDGAGLLRELTISGVMVSLPCPSVPLTVTGARFPVFGLMTPPPGWWGRHRKVSAPPAISSQLTVVLVSSSLARSRGEAKTSGCNYIS